MIDSQIGIKQFIKTLNFKSQNFQKIENLNGQEIGYICLYKYNDSIQNDTESLATNITDQQIDEINKYIPIKQKFNKPPGIGLQNVGATCYMNATLQCLCQIEKLVDHFKSYERINSIINDYKVRGEDCLSTSFKNLIENLWPTDAKYIEKNKKYNRENTNNKYFIPKEFKEKISKMNNLFEGAKANDSKDLVNFIIMRLHEELNEGKKSNINIMAPPQEDQMSMYNYFKMNNDQENKSIITDLFYGIYGTMNQCSHCQTKKHNFQIGFF
jgi:ubiquitin C-terminal hydrolase